MTIDISISTLVTGGVVALLVLGLACLFLWIKAHEMVFFFTLKAAMQRARLPMTEALTDYSAMWRMAEEETELYAVLGALAAARLRYRRAYDAMLYQNPIRRDQPIYGLVACIAHGLFVFEDKKGNLEAALAEFRAAEKRLTALKAPEAARAAADVEAVLDGMAAALQMPGQSATG